MGKNIENIYKLLGLEKDMFFENKLPKLSKEEIRIIGLYRMKETRMKGGFKIPCMKIEQIAQELYMDCDTVSKLVYLLEERNCLRKEGKYYVYLNFPKPPLC